MKTFCFLCLIAAPLLAQDAKHPIDPKHATEKGAPPAVPAGVAAAVAAAADKSILSIDPKNRASDYVQAFELLRKEKPSTKINLRISTGGPLVLSELTASSHGTLLFAKVSTNSGAKYLIIPIEEIVEIAYSPN